MNKRPYYERNSSRAGDVRLACRWMAICAAILGGWGLGQWLYRVLG